MRKTHKISWMISGWILEAELGASAGGTAGLTIGCPDDFFAVRLGFPNTTRNSWALTKVIASPSQSFNDYVNPVQPSNWRPITFAMGGEDIDRIVTRPNAPTQIIVQPAEVDGATGEVNEPRWTWTDWTPIASDEPDPETGMRVLMLRALVPSEQTICFAHGQMKTLSRNRSLNKGFDFLITGIKFNYDRVTDPDTSLNDSTEMWIDNALVGGSVFPIVQFLTKNAGIVGMVTGDSHHQGTSTTEQFSGFLYRAMTCFGQQYIGNLPVGVVNCAVGGLSSDRFFARFSMLLTSVRPSFVVLPGWTYNDTTDGVHADAAAGEKFFARLVMAIELCRAQGCLPICLTPFPRDRASMNDTQLRAWRELRQLILEDVGRETLVLDAAQILGERDGEQLSGTYREDFSEDGVHPDDRGHQMIAGRLTTLVGAICAQPQHVKLRLNNDDAF